MYIKYEWIGDRHLLYIPEGERWSFYFLMMDEDGNDDYGVYLRIGNEEPIQVLDTDLFCMGRPNLHYQAVGILYEEVVDSISEMIKKDPSTHYIDVMSAVDQLVSSKYEEIWLKEGYITEPLERN